MAKFEEQLAHIKNKADLYDWVEKLPEDFQGIILVTHDDDQGDECYKYHEIGKDITMEKSVFIASSFIQFMLTIDRTR